MNKKNENRLRELIDEINKIFSSEKPQSSVEILRDINKELYEIVNKRNK